MVARETKVQLGLILPSTSIEAPAASIRLYLSPFCFRELGVLAGTRSTEIGIHKAIVFNTAEGGEELGHHARAGPAPVSTACGCGEPTHWRDARRFRFGSHFLEDQRKYNDEAILMSCQYPIKVHGLSTLLRVGLGP